MGSMTQRRRVLEVFSWQQVTEGTEPMEVDQRDLMDAQELLDGLGKHRMTHVKLQAR
jgi:hypothetical protein